MRIDRLTSGTLAVTALMGLLLTTACTRQHDDPVEDATESTGHSNPESGPRTAPAKPEPVEEGRTPTSQPDIKPVKLGSFALTVPADWETFGPGEAAALRQQFTEQSEQIYRQFSGADDPTKTVDVIGFHIGGRSGSFALVSLTVPPSADLIPLLKGQVQEKMAWGVREGYIQKFLGLSSVDNENFSGFYTRAIGRDGGIEVSGGIEHKSLKNTVLQLTLLAPKQWDEARAVAVLVTLLDSVTLGTEQGRPK